MNAKFLAIGLICAGQALDYASTRYGLSRGAEEINPLIGALGGLGPAKVYSTLVLTSTALLVPQRYVLTLGAATFCLLSAVAGWNMVAASVSEGSSSMNEPQDPSKAPASETALRRLSQP